MTFYNDMSITDFLNYASESSDEMASLGNGRMVDYETGKYFEVRDEQTAVFVASARNMVEELCKRLNKQEQELIALRGFANYILRETDTAIKGHGYKPLEQLDPDNTKMDIHVFVSELQKAQQTVRATREDKAS